MPNPLNFNLITSSYTIAYPEQPQQASIQSTSNNGFFFKCGEQP